MRETEPKTIVKGENIQWTRGFDDYPASAWTLAYRFRGGGPGFDVAATADGNDFKTVITPTLSNLPDPGKYLWQAWATKIADSTETRIVASGSVTVKAGFVTGETGNIELRTPAKIMLDTLDAALLKAGASDVIEYEVTTPAGSHRIKRSSRSEVISQRKYWAAIVSRENTAERIRTGGKFGKPIGVRMP